MKYVDYEEFEQGDKVRLATDWYENHGFKHKEGDVFIVKWQNYDEVYTDKGTFDFSELELVEE